MKPDPRILDDIAKVAGGAVNIVSGLQQQIRDDLRVRMEEMAARMDLVPREDMDRALETVAALRRRIDDLENRMAKLEKGNPVRLKSKAKAKKATRGKKKA